MDMCFAPRFVFNSSSEQLTDGLLAWIR